MALALAERKIFPDLLVGTSVGAVNAGWLAGHPGPEGARMLADVWRSIRRSDIFPTDLRGGLLGFVSGWERPAARAASHSGFPAFAARFTGNAAAAGLPLLEAIARRVAGIVAVPCREGCSVELAYTP